MKKWANDYEIAAFIICPVECKLTECDFIGTAYYAFKRINNIKLHDFSCKIVNKITSLLLCRADDN